MLNALSIDVEDYFQVSAAEPFIRYQQWDEYELRVEQNVSKVLGLLKEFNLTATFFVLGWVAKKLPQMVKEIYSQGHEIASHGYSHRLVYELGPELFREDVKKSKEILENIIQTKVIGYRAPSNSITDGSLWALEILAEEGFVYDSSVFPVRHFRYGIPTSKRFVHRIDLGGNRELIEVPHSTVKIGRVNFAVCGGGYLRFYPLNIVKWAIRGMNRQGYPAMVYFHPWEIDPAQPKMPLRGNARFKHYIKLSTHIDKLKRLFSEVRFAPIGELVLSGATQM